MAVPTVVHGDYEWDTSKAAANERKHGVPFTEAATALAHPAVAVFDDGSGAGTYKAVGLSHRGRLLTVVFEVRRRQGRERERIVSAWRSTRDERRLYMTRGAG